MNARGRPEGGYLRLLEEIAKSTWQDDGDGIREEGELGYDFCQVVKTNWDYLVGLRAFVSKQGVNLVVTEEWGATFNDYKKRLKEGDVAILWVRDWGGTGVHHYVTGASYDDVKIEIGVSDPWTTGEPGHNNDPTRKSYDVWRVTSGEPFQVDIPGRGVKSIGKIIYIWPPSFTVSDLTIDPQRVNIGEPVSIAVNVKNPRDIVQTYSVALEINGVVESTKKGMLAGGETRSVAFTVRKGTAGIYSVEVDGLTGTFTVLRPPAFELSNLSIIPSNVEPGKPVSISVDVKNTGEVEDTHAVALRINGTVEATKEITLVGGATGSVVFTVTKDIPGTYGVDADGLTGTFKVLKPPEFKLSDLSIMPEDAEVGKPVRIYVSVTNTGELEGTHTVTLRINGEVETSKEVTVVAGGTVTVVL